jgi:hypothetical protein
MTFYSVLKNILPIISGSIIGSSIALFGTWLQGRNNLKMLLRKEDIDYTRAKDQRCFDLRKDNYLSALSTIAELMNILMDFTQPGLDFDKFAKRIQEVLKELCSLDIVADSNTLAPIHKFQKYYFQCYVELINLKIPVEQLVNEEKSAQSWYKFYSDKISENIEQLKQNPYSDSLERQKYVELFNEKYNELCHKRDACSSDLDKLRKQILYINLDLKRNYAEKIIIMQQHVSEFVQYARKDLGLSLLPIDRNDIDNFYKTIKTALDTTFNNVKSLTN